MFPNKHPFKRSGQKIIIPKEFEVVMLEYIKKCIKDKPRDLIKYTVDHFVAKREQRKIEILSTEELSEKDSYEAMSEEPMARAPPRARRATVYSEAFDPELEEETKVELIVYPKSEEQRELLTQAIQNIFLFRSLDAVHLQEVLDAMFERTVNAGDCVITQGTDGDNFYIIENGIFEASILIDGLEKVVRTYEGEGSFGELALMYNTPRAATVRAVTNGFLWAMDRNTFRRIVLKAAFKKRRMYEDLLNTVPMLSTLQQYERLNLADALVRREHKAGEYIINQGDTADGMYFVEQGIVKIIIASPDGEKIEVNRIGRGGYFGELALVTHKPRAASVCAMQDVQLAFLDVAAFERLLGPCMEIMKRNINLYNSQMRRIYGSRTTIPDLANT